MDRQRADEIMEQILDLAGELQEIIHDDDDEGVEVVQTENVVQFGLRYKPDLERIPVKLDAEGRKEGRQSI